MSFSIDEFQGIPDMSFFDPSGSVDDLAFAVAIYQIDQYGSDLENYVTGIKIISELKKAYNERLQKLKDYLVKADSDSDYITIPADEAEKIDYEWSDSSGGVVQNSDGELAEKNARYSLVDENGNKIYIEVQKNVESSVPVNDQVENYEGTVTEYVPVEGNENYVRQMQSQFPGSTVMVEVKREIFENEINRLQTKIDELGSDGEIQLLAINRALSRRNQALQLASNIMSSINQSAMGIIQNMK